jgi:hypothetical protein
VPAAVAGDDVGIAGKQVDDLALALVTPQDAGDTGSRHGPSGEGRTQRGRTERASIIALVAERTTWRRPTFSLAGENPLAVINAKLY